MYKHKIVQALASLIELYGGGGKDPMMRAVWYGIKGQVPHILQGLDDNSEIVVEIQEKVLEALDIQVPEGYQWEITEEEIKVAPIPVAKPVLIEEIKEVVKKAPQRRSRKAEAAAEVEVAIEPDMGEDNGLKVD